MQLDSRFEREELLIGQDNLAFLSNAKVLIFGEIGRAHV